MGAPYAGYTPTPAEIRRMRGDLTQTQAANLVFTTDRAWRRWEAGDSQMHPAIYQFFLIQRKELNG